MSDTKTKRSKDFGSKNQKAKPSSTKFIYPFSAISGFTGSKIFDSLLLYGIENCDRLRNTTATDTFPLDKYYDLEGKLEHTKGGGEKKKTPFNTGRHGKVIVQYICTRFTWEVEQIDIKDFNPVAIPQFILNGVSGLEFNISELIISTVERVPISNLIKKSHGLEQELMTKIGSHIDDIELNFYVAKTLVRFIKILAFNFSNEFWYNNAKTIGERNFRTVLAGCEAYLPNGSVSFHGIMSEMNNFLKDNVKKIEKGEKKKKKKDSNDDSDDGGPDSDAGGPDSDAVDIYADSDQGSDSDSDSSHDSSKSKSKPKPKGKGKENKKKMKKKLAISEDNDEAPEYQGE
jgi:hypothetical protein